LASDGGEGEPSPTCVRVVSLSLSLSTPFPILSCCAFRSCRSPLRVSHLPLPSSSCLGVWHHAALLHVCVSLMLLACFRRTISAR
jgi:hypothetical protein